MAKLRREDQVRDGYVDEKMFHPGAKQILGFDKPEDGVIQGTGQIMSFGELGFPGIKDRPDGWYLPENSYVAIVLETKSEKENIHAPKWEKELLKNVKIVSQRYKHVIGILYNGIETKVYIDGVWSQKFPSALQPKEYYLAYFKSASIDRDLIWKSTAKLNNMMEKQIKIPDLHDRMVLVACTIATIVDGKYPPLKGMTFNVFVAHLANALGEILADKKTHLLPKKFQTMIETLRAVKKTSPGDPVMDDFLSLANEIAANVPSYNWNGDDVMSLFFREFHRYKKKTVSGQVFTPENWASFIYRITETTPECYILDCCAGSGTFLTVGLANMIKTLGGEGSIGVDVVRNRRLYGMEYDSRIFSLCVANMIVHKDGLSNLEHMDARTEEAAEWITSIGIQAKEDGCRIKVHMNPPYEETYGCMTIVQNVMDNVPTGSICAFILPDKKLEKYINKTKKILKNHTLRTIIKMPENTFDAGVTTSIFVFETGRPQKMNEDEIFCCYIEDDGFERVKNQGRQDIKGKWQAIEDYWVPIVINRNCSDEAMRDNIQRWKASEHLSYQMPEKEFVLYEEDFMKTMMDYLMFEQQIDVKEFREKIADTMIYSGDVNKHE